MPMYLIQNIKLFSTLFLQWKFYINPSDYHGSSVLCRKIKGERIKFPLK